ncbi:MAG: biopolymer transporter ExbD [Thermoguttaceae bacterium]|nr:biopolymer transporter ExbD [Thermoguttaceae bacterium]
MKAPRHTGAAVGFNMTPMIDVVFLLIIFFLVASHFTNQENAVEVELPKAEEGKEIPQDEIRRLTLSVPRAGELFIGVRPVVHEELSALLLQEKKHQDETAAPFQLRIRAGRSVPYAEVEPLLLAAAEAGISDVQFAVMEE